MAKAKKPAATLLRVTEVGVVKKTNDLDLATDQGSYHLLPASPEIAEALIEALHAWIEADRERFEKESEEDDD